MGILTQPQWDVLLHSNGSPKGTRLYHGGSGYTPISGMQWLSFEPEHAYLFAKPLGSASFSGRQGNKVSSTENHFQVVLAVKDEKEPGIWSSIDQGENNTATHDCFHEYQTSRQLRLLYMDGMSAAKSTMGTLDLQDLILLELEPKGKKISDAERLDRICDIIENHWENKIDGVIRMEAGFEIVLCRSQDLLEPLYITQTKPRSTKFLGLNVNEGDGGFGYYMAVASRYSGIGGGRVELDFERFVSGFSYVEDLGRDPGLPRIQSLTKDARRRMRSDIENVVLMKKDQNQGRNWQAVTDMIVSRYGNLLNLSAEAPDMTMFRIEVDAMLQHFVDYSQPLQKVDVRRCASQYLPAGEPQGMAWRAILKVSMKICETLAEVLKCEDNALAKKRISELRTYLGWTSWSMCAGCSEKEICWIPMWPLGTLEDRMHPKCISEPPNPVEASYWIR